MANQDAIDGPHFCALALGGKCGRWEDILEWEVDFPDTVPKPPFVPPVAPAVISLLPKKYFFKFYLNKYGEITFLNSNYKFSFTGEFSNN